ncbi:hypothetical protein Tco_0801152 [Tanacetum coccineum]|uniref:Uncharacterized protein n=1 Tax=Tanacetum coccineum TaxID=301880 RepID=A0ABQ4ZV61_9ASTR
MTSGPSVPSEGCIRMRTMKVMQKVLQVYNIQFADIISASVHFESAFGPEGSIHLGSSSSPNAPTNVVPSDATAPVTSIQEGSPPSPPLIQPIIPIIVPQIPQPGPATKSPAYRQKLWAG